MSKVGILTKFERRFLNAAFFCSGVYVLGRHTIGQAEKGKHYAKMGILKLLHKV